jgi:hypothetical protein
VLRLARRTSCLPGFFGGLGLRPASLIFQPKPLGLAWSCFSALASPDNLFGLEPGAYRGMPFEKRLLEAWYTGVFKMDGLSEVRSFDTTLMWRAAGVDPPPSTCNGGPESWASAPSKI